MTCPPGCGRRWPFGQTRFEPPIPIGTIGAPLRRASRATPSRAAWSAPSGLRVPSGKTNRTWPSSRIRLGQPERLDVGRCRDRPGGRRRWPPPSRRSASRTAPSCRASGSAGRASGSATTPSTGASRFEAWLAAMISGPSRGISSIAPSIEIRLIARPKMRPPNVDDRDQRRDRAVDRLAASLTGAAPGRPYAPAPLAAVRRPAAPRRRGSR